MLGCSFSKALMLAWIAATSWGWLQPCQNLMVTGSLASADDWLAGVPVHPAASRAIATVVIRTAGREKG